MYTDIKNIWFLHLNSGKNYWLAEIQVNGKNNDPPSQNIVNFWSFVESEHIDWFIIVFFLFSIKNFNLASQHYCDQSTWLSKNKMYMH